MSFAETLDLLLNLKQSEAEAYRLLIKEHGEAALTERSYREWFKFKFKNGEFEGRPKVYEDRIGTIIEE